MKPMPNCGERTLTLPDFASLVNSAQLPPTVRAVQAAIETQIGASQRGQGCKDTSTGRPGVHTLDVAQLGGVQHWESWLASIGQLETDRAIMCGPALWDLFASLARALSGPGLAGLAGEVAVLANRCSSRLPQSASDNSGSSSSVSAVASAMSNTLACIGERLPEIAALEPCSGHIADGFVASTRLLSVHQAARTPAGAHAIESFLKAALAIGTEGCAAECFSLLDAAEKEGGMPLMNLAWKLLKLLCMHPACDMSAIEGALERSAHAASLHLVAAATSPSSSSMSSPQPGADHIASFHCSNFARIVRDAPALAGNEFPLRRVAKVLAPTASAISCASAARFRELFGKLVDIVLARWISSPIKSNFSGVSSVRDDLAPLLEAPAAMEILLTNSLLLLAKGRSTPDDKGDLKHWGPREKALMTVQLQIIDKRVHEGDQWQLSTVDLDALAVLCAAGVPGIRPRLLAWITSKDAKLYGIALQLHARLPKWMGDKRSLSWAQILVQGVVAVVEKPCGQGTLGRIHSQAASAIAVLLSQLPLATVVPWLNAALLPLRSSKSSGSAMPGAWLLARRLGAVIPSTGAGTVFHEIARITVDELSTGVDAAGDVKASVQSSGLRCLAAFTRSGILVQEDLERAGAGLRRLLSKPVLPPPVRTEAWVWHAQVCLRTRAIDEFRIALRYAVKHLASDASAGARVAAVIAQAPIGFLEGVAGTLEGLCSVEWPLRISGLAAAKSVQARAMGASVTAQEIATVDAVACALAAFAEEYGCVGGKPWANPTTGDDCAGAQAYQAKRRRVLLELAALPVQMADAGGPQAADPDFAELCLSARGRIDAWLQRAC